MLAAATSLHMPSAAAPVVDMLADSASLVAPFTIGAVLWHAGRHAHPGAPVGD